MNKNDDDFDGFAVNIFLDEDGDYLAHLVELPNVSAFADTREEALKEVAEAWQCVKESYLQDRKPIPQAPSREEYEGPYNFPVEAQLHVNWRMKQQR